MGTCDYAQLTFFTPDGVRMGSTNRMTRFRWARKLNDVGSAEVLLSLKEFDYKDYTQEDLGMVIEYGNISGNLKPAGNTYWFLVGFRETGGLNQEESLLLRFEDSMSLLRDRIIAYRHDTPRGTSPQAYFNERANDAIVRIFRENLGDLAIGDRNLTPRVTFVPASTPTPQINKDAPWKNVLSVMQEIARASRDKNVPLYFDVIPRFDGRNVTFSFQTFSPQRGNDRRNAGIIRSTDPLVALEYFDGDFRVPNVAYVGGSGRGRERLVRTIEHQRARRSFFARREAFKSVQSSNPQVLDDEGHTIVNDTAGIYTLSAELLDELGDQFEFGDRLTVEHRGLVFDAEVSNIAGEWQNQTHTDRTIIRSRES